jgi:hypothetical protein
LATTVVLPAVIRALQVITDNLALTKRGAAMDTGIAQYMRVALSVAKGDKVQTQNLNPQWGIVRHLIAGGNRVPEIHVHVRNIARNKGWLMPGSVTPQPVVRPVGKAMVIYRR